MAARDLIRGVVLIGGLAALFLAVRQSVPTAQASVRAGSAIPFDVRNILDSVALSPDSIGPAEDRQSRSSAGLFGGILSGLFGGSDTRSAAPSISPFDTTVFPAFDIPAFDTTLIPALPDLPGPQSAVSGDVEAVARTIWGEARGEGTSGMEAVASVIMNRVRDPRWPGSPSAVAFQSRQFSTWNADDPNRPLALDVTERDRRYAQALNIARNAVAGRLSDRTGGATHFHTRAIFPAWAATGKVSARIGSHVFYVGVA